MKSLYLVKLDSAMNSKEDKENEDEGATSASKQGGAKLLLVQPSRIVMFVHGCGIRPFLFSNVCSGDVSQTAVYQRVAQDAVVSSMNGMNACVLAYGQVKPLSATECR